MIILKEIKIFLKNMIYELLVILPLVYIYHDNLHKLILTLFIFIGLVSISLLNRWIYYIVYLYISILGFILVHISFHWGGVDSVVDRIRVAVISPPQEMMEYIYSYLDLIDILVLLYLIVLNISLYQKKFLITSFKLKIGISIFLSMIVFVVMSREPINLLSKTVEVYKSSKIIIDRREYLDKFIVKKDNSKNGFYDKIVVIQGESANRRFMNVYGYDIENTPFLTYEKNSDDYFYVFENVLATINQTRYEIPLLYSSVKMDSFNTTFSKTVSIFTILKRFGYRTYWISNQGKIGEHETLVSSIASESDKYIFFNQLDYTHSKSDIVFLDYLNSLKLDNNKEFFVFHLIGSHSDYKMRYLDSKALYKNTDNILQEYVNSIFFTDYIIKNIFDKFKKSDLKVLIIYLSDHGEVVSNRRHGHGFLPPYKDEYEIPFIIYSSHYNEKLEDLFRKNRKGTIINSEILDNIILYLDNIDDKIQLDNNSSKVYSLEPTHIFDYNQLSIYVKEH